MSFHNAQAYDDDKIYDLKGETFQLGPIAGLVLAPPLASDRFNLFVEGVWQWRSFGSVEWSGDSNTVPSQYPKHFSVNTAMLNFGVQLETKAHGR